MIPPKSPATTTAANERKKAVRDGIGGGASREIACRSRLGSSWSDTPDRTAKRAGILARVREWLVAGALVEAGRCAAGAQPSARWFVRLEHARWRDRRRRRDPPRRSHPRGRGGDRSRVTRWEGPIYEVRAVAVDLGWSLRAEMHRAARVRGRAPGRRPRRDRRRGGVLSPRRVRGASRGRGRAWVHEPLGEWLARALGTRRRAWLPLRRARQQSRLARRPTRRSVTGRPGHGGEPRAGDPARRSRRVLRQRRAAGRPELPRAARSSWAGSGDAASWLRRATRRAASASTPRCRWPARAERVRDARVPRATVRRLRDGEQGGDGDPAVGHAAGRADLARRGVPRRARARRSLGHGPSIARHLRERIRAETELTASVGCRHDEDAGEDRERPREARRSARGGTRERARRSCTRCRSSGCGASVRRRSGGSPATRCRRSVTSPHCPRRPSSRRSAQSQGAHLHALAWNRDARPVEPRSRR